MLAKIPNVGSIPVLQWVKIQSSTIPSVQVLMIQKKKIHLKTIPIPSWQVLREHLLTNSYTQLSKSEATTRMDSIKSTLENIFQANLHLLSKPEVTYFKRSFTTPFRLPMFYGLPKIHKNPISLRPVVSSSSSLLSVFSIWLDYGMKDLLPLVIISLTRSREPCMVTAVRRAD